MHAAAILPARPHLQHIPHVHHVRRRVRRDAGPVPGTRVLHLEPGVLVLQQQRDGAEVRVRAGAELAFCGRLRGGVVQQAERGGGGGGDEGVEDVGAVGEGGGD